MTTGLPAFDADILFENTDLMLRSEWLEARRAGLGGSDAAACMGLSPWVSPVALYLDKTDPQPDVDKEIFEAGRRAEPMIRSWFADQTGLTVERVPLLLRSRQWEFMLANIDGLATDPETGEQSIFEAKNVGAYNKAEWAEGPPLHYRLQGQHYLAVTGLSRVYFAALVGGNSFIWFAVERDEEVIADLVRAEESFWTRVTLRRMPDVDGAESTKAALKAHFAEVTREEIEVGSDFITLLERRAAQKTVIAIETARLNEIENRMTLAMDGAEIATHEGIVVATWKVINKASYTVKAQTYRQWNIKKTKEKA